MRPSAPTSELDVNARPAPSRARRTTARPAFRAVCVVGVALVMLGLGVVGVARPAQRSAASCATRRRSGSRRPRSTAAQARERESELAGDLREAQAKLALLETRLSESQSQQAALEALYRELAPSRDDLALNEVEQVLLIANQQLALAGNVPAALAALQLADAKLARIDRPPLGPLRRALARDVDRLKALPFVDVTAITLKLDQAIAQVDTLPLAKDERLPPPKPEHRRSPTSRRGGARCARSCSELRVAGAARGQRPTGGAAGRARPGVLPAREPAAAPAVRARRRSSAGRRRRSSPTLRAAQAWLRKYFDTRTKPVQTLLDTLGADARDADARRPSGPRGEPRRGSHAQGGAGARAAADAADSSASESLATLRPMRALLLFLLLGAVAVALALFAQGQRRATCCSSRRRIASRFRSTRSSLLVGGRFRARLCGAALRLAPVAAAARGARASQAQHVERARSKQDAALVGAARGPLRPRAPVRRGGARDSAFVRARGADRRARGARDARLRRRGRAARASGCAVRRACACRG